MIDTIEHEHRYLSTFIRTINGKDYVIYAGERPTDKIVQMCDCGDIKEDDRNELQEEKA